MLQRSNQDFILGLLRSILVNGPPRRLSELFTRRNLSFLSKFWTSFLPKLTQGLLPLTPNSPSPIDASTIRYRNTLAQISYHFGIYQQQSRLIIKRRCLHFRYGRYFWWQIWLIIGINRLCLIYHMYYYHHNCFIDKGCSFY